ncbi:membrane protein [Polymorphobacter multimanifer]|uniref:Putative membrane protein n=1 Tax=Polymorphobacter multimanifer TaxID=1070431 RepID=A0A841LAM4_9SPHN|nr:DUF2244 domain-containing protein [Polymorphobacter multimanifer]MBB6228701.1 putative membrane protein [Polymorphobacter multimanifer]GGI87034.1 membrane protein [Polymorphobacter multimanifer]
MPPVLDLTLTPNRSFDRRHMPWVVGGVGLLFFLGGLRFLALGAWPILPFMALDVGLLWWAFRASYASGKGHERLLLADDHLELLRVSAQGAERRFGFEPYWTRVHLEETALGDVKLWLAARERRVSVGRFLSPRERREVGALITAVLADYRAGNPSTSSIV